MIDPKTLTLGTRIHATYADNVATGALVRRSAYGWWLEGASPDRAGWHVPDEATFEIVSEPEPPIGTVVLDFEGEAWQRRNDAWRLVGSKTNKHATLEDLEDEYGPLTVLSLEWVE